MESTERRAVMAQLPDRMEKAGLARTASQAKRY
jgi:predicted Fe-S protein YdhL (DUF1289 family)